MPCLASKWIAIQAFAFLKIRSYPTRAGDLHVAPIIVIIEFVWDPRSTTPRRGQAFLPSKTPDPFDSRDICPIDIERLKEDKLA
jgi:hypothetical protein